MAKYPLTQAPYIPYTCNVLAMMKDHIDLRGFLAVLVLTLLWGVNYSAIKLTYAGISPIFSSFLRSAIASGCGVIYCLVIRQPLFHRDIRLFHGFVAGMLFGLEFVFLYLGIRYTDAARSAVLMYLSPFVVAIGAHLFLKERLDIIKAGGLVLAFIGVYLVFRGRPSAGGELMIVGDMLVVVGAILWGATTLYIKKYLAATVHPINTFLYQLVFSLPILFLCTYFMEDRWVFDLNSQVIGLLLFQSVVIAFASYLVWFKLIHVYPVGRLSAFTFLTPIFGVCSGALFMKEDLTTGLIAGLILVCIGVYCANYKK
jgi:drug/metabolite transporter (DMT)-like permease